MSKEYGKLTVEQFRALVRRVPELRKLQQDLAGVLARASKEKLDSILVGGFNWGEIYEYSFPEHLAIAVVAFNAMPMLNEALASSDPQQHVLDRIDSPDDSVHPAFSAQDLLGLLLSVQRTMQSVMVHQRSLSGLVEDVRARGDLDAFFKAVRIDRMVMFCTTFADRIARAEIEGDEKFFVALSNAIKRPDRKHWEGYSGLRFALFMLRELGFDSMSDAELEKLLVHQLCVFDDSPGAPRAIRKHYNQFRKKPIT